MWGWLWKASHHVEKVHRPILFNLFKNLVYSKTEDEYSEALEVFDNSEVIEKYTNFSTHVENNLLPRKCEWAISDRIANKLETHGTNTTNYVESSFRLTKENQFHRIRAYNLPDLLETVLDDSDYYVQRCIDLGNNRTSKLINQKSKYLFSKTNIDVSRIKVLGDNTYHVPSENEQDTYYFVDMEIGLCECPVGLSRGPCKHKHVLTKEFNLISFDTIPTESCEMRSFYHFLGTGQREVPTWYRPLHLPEMDLSTIPAVEDISASRIPLHQPVHDVLTIPAENENNASEDDDNRIYVKTSFLILQITFFECWRNVLEMTQIIMRKP